MAVDSRLHVPAAAWAAYIEFSDGICPLTRVENELRASAGLGDYTEHFVARYLFPVLFPDGLTRAGQATLGTILLALNLVLDAHLFKASTTNATPDVEQTGGPTIIVDERAITAYRARLAQHEASLRTFCATHGCPCVRVASDAPFQQQLAAVEAGEAPGRPRIVPKRAEQAPGGGNANDGT